MRPGSFDAASQEDWSQHVLIHGLPDLPNELNDDESVPVARWIGPTTAAVLHIRRRVFGLETVMHQETHVDNFSRDGDNWQHLGGGGGGWKDSSPLSRVDVAADHVNLNGMAANGPTVSLYGVVGVDAKWATVEQADQTTRQPLDAPLGAIVVSARSEHSFVVRIFDQDGRLLSEHSEPAADLSLPVFAEPARLAQFSSGPRVRLRRRVIFKRNESIADDAND